MRLCYNYSRKTGCGGVVVRNSAVFAALICAAFGFVSAQADDCPALKRLASIDLNMAAPFPLVPVEIAGAQKLMVLAPGEPLSTLSEQTAADLNLTPHMSKLMISQFGKSDQRMVMARMKLGNMNGASIRFLVDTDLRDHGMNGKVAGILAADILSNFDVAIDFSTGKMDLFEHYQCAGKAVYWPHSTTVIVPFRRQITMLPVPLQTMIVTPQLDGKPLTAIVDTSAVHSTMSTATAANLFGIKSDAQTTVHKFRSLRFGEVSIPDPEIQIVSDTRPRDLTVTGSNIATRGSELNLVLGMDVLRQLHMYIAYRDEKLYLTPAGTAPAKATN